MAERISAQQARQHLASGNAMLVCGYDSEEKFQENHIEGAIRLSEFQSQASSIPKNREIIFYCA
jgi:rhodanese-related sulfurtransferase